MRSKLPPTKIPCEVCGHILVERGDDGTTVLHERTEPCQHGCCRVHFCEGCGAEVSTTGWGAVGGAECACWGGTAASCRGEAPQ